LMKERRLTHHKDQCRHFIQFLKKNTYILTNILNRVRDLLFPHTQNIVGYNSNL